MIYAPEAIMYHKHQATVAQDAGRRRIRLITARNSYIFLYKNILDWDMLRRHFLWSLRFFLRGSLRGEFRFQKAFLMTVPRLAQILKRRGAERRVSLLSDGEVIERIADGEPPIG